MDGPPDPPPHAKATRADWLAVAKSALISGGVSEVKIQPLGQKLGVSRSSFYWYFKDHSDLLQALLEDWEATNTGVIVDYAARPARTITEAVSNLFLAFLTPDWFDPRLDFAVREWSRRSPDVRRRIEVSDAARVEAIAGMFACHDYSQREAEIRARILYYQQIGYYALDLREPLDDRLARVPDYLFGFTGRDAAQGEVDAFEAAVRTALSGRNETS